MALSCCAFASNSIAIASSSHPSLPACNSSTSARILLWNWNSGCGPSTRALRSENLLGVRRAWICDRRGDTPLFGKWRLVIGSRRGEDLLQFGRRAWFLGGRRGEGRVAPASACHLVVPGQKQRGLGRSKRFVLDKRRDWRGRIYEEPNVCTFGTVNEVERLRGKPVHSAAAVSGYTKNTASSIWATICAVWGAIVGSAQNLRFGHIGWTEIVLMMRIVILGIGAVGAYLASKKAWSKIKEHAEGKSEGDGSPMQVLARGATCLQSNMGPWSISDLTLGLAAMAKVTEKEPPNIPGKEAKDLAQDSRFLLRAQHWRAMAEAVYVSDSASFSLFSQLPESAIVAAEWEPCKDTFRPAYAVFVDAPYGAVVLAVRGTSHVIDMLLNSGTSPEPFLDGYAHGGFAHATEVLSEEVLPHIREAFKKHDSQKNLKLVVVGHSMGAAVGILCAFKLREEFKDLECWGYCPPACVSRDLARESQDFAICFVSAHDLVPRFSLQSVERLREQMSDFDWSEAERVGKGDEDWENIKKAVGAMRKFQNVQESGLKKMQSIGNHARESVTGGADSTEDEESHKPEEFHQPGNGLSNGGAENGEHQQDEKSKKPEPPAFFPPGKLLMVGCHPPGCGKMPQQRSDVAPQRNYGSYPTFDEARKIKWVMHEVQAEDLERIIVSPWCVSDHMLGNLCEAISYFQAHAAPAA